ncbi:MAG: PhzF family phenazine biosynthesis protein [Bacteroidota bacterium]
MELTIYQVDAFTDQLFGGNPAAVVPLSEWLSTETMQRIAMENNLSETAFIVPENDGYYIRWFTPAIEVDLCGHATLATAHIVFTELGWSENSVNFNSKSGLLEVTKNGDLYTMNFPTDTIEEVAIPSEIIEGLGVSPTKVFKGKDDYLAIFDNQSIIEDFQPNYGKLAQLAARGVITSALGKEVDFVSRCFYPAAGINEDPVTGSAHTTMAPYWAKVLDKEELTASQLSARGGVVKCYYKGNRVDLSGQAVTYLKGTIFV